MALAQIAAATPKTVLHVARDESRLMAMAQALAFFAPGMDAVILPPWDCLPYDRVSPNGEVAAQRLEALARLAASEAGAAPRFVLTTVTAALQRMPARKLLAGVRQTIAAGARLDPTTLLGYLARHGYRRAGTVREPGEYAVRGGIIDLFAPAAAEPVRLDFFGDTIESMRRFDPLSQRTTGAIEGLQLGPVSEVMLDDAAITRFRAGYAALFGVATDDPLYEAVCAGRHHIGMEHWLPLFHETLETVFDYLPEATVSLDHHAQAACDTIRRGQAAGRVEAPRCPTSRCSPIDSTSMRRSGRCTLLTGR